MTDRAELSTDLASLMSVPGSGPGVVRLRCRRVGDEEPDMSKKRRRDPPEQMTRRLAEGNRLLASGQELDEVCHSQRSSLSGTYPNNTEGPETQRFRAFSTGSGGRI